MAIAEKIQSFLGIFKAEDKQNKPLKPLKSIEYPAKILIIDCDLYDICSREDFIYFYFSEEVENNLLNFYFARNFSEASAQIQVDPPDLIICELFVSCWHEMLAGKLKKGETNMGYGLNIFQRLDELDLEFRIPVIFYSTLVSHRDYKERAEQLGAFDCIEKCSRDSEQKLKLAIQKALNI
ncbi:MAG: hypothetical protein QNJ72_23900 [Pleurocapsa sp. MO_226.B13]|nr:hypothetical protein [Pleurocapsa sp. MO_226.B13]